MASGAGGKSQCKGPEAEPKLAMEPGGWIGWSPGSLEGSLEGGEGAPSRGHCGTGGRGEENVLSCVPDIGVLRSTSLPSPSLSFPSRQMKLLPRSRCPWT